MANEITLDEGRSCFTCANLRLCFLRRKVDDIVNNGGGLDVLATGEPSRYVGNVPITPNNCMVIYNAVASACIEYSQKRA